MRWLPTILAWTSWVTVFACALCTMSPGHQARVLAGYFLIATCALVVASFFVGAALEIGDDE